MKIESRRGNSGVRKVIRRGSAKEEVRKHQDRVCVALFY